MSSCRPCIRPKSPSNSSSSVSCATCQYPKHWMAPHSSLRLYAVSPDPVTKSTKSYFNAHCFRVPRLVPRNGLLHIRAIVGTLVKLDVWDRCGCLLGSRFAPAEQSLGVDSWYSGLRINRRWRSLLVCLVRIIFGPPLIDFARPPLFELLFP